MLQTRFTTRLLSDEVALLSAPQDDQLGLVHRLQADDFLLQPLGADSRLCAQSHLQLVAQRCWILLLSDQAAPLLSACREQAELTLAAAAAARLGGQGLDPQRFLQPRKLVEALLVRGVPEAADRFFKALGKLRARAKVIYQGSAKGTG